jgi:nitrogenase iron protein NifH
VESGGQRIVFLGKGGIGKSTIVANLGVLYARSGSRVLHVGCDPKHDSSILLTDNLEIPTVVDAIVRTGDVDARDVVVRGREGIDFVEAGGPEPGVGCAGRGIARMLEFFKETALIERRGYDVVLFDLLGDIVCGGFATPLRKGFGRKVFIVVSDELMSLYAANNIARAVVNCAPNGVVLGGLVLNLKDARGDEALVGRFAERLGTRVVAVLPRDPRFREAEYARLTLAEHAPRSRPVETLATLARDILATDPATLPLPSPLPDQEFYSRSREGFA